ncbi:uncharacterized protein Bfra_005644 [Botrytis fragariae]|uniref:Uncharacterized protein n=1 Tax=Botrytis fragariae TaxID=1964551 RepID=A0A8H6AQV9_9HELO|nr:uncharacterized protein Bfra_005644 [Botrytis fragariae]KAF5872288.1 hypothetical protein Bfra_005644 [Botrytis fragariae]
MAFDRVNKRPHDGGSKSKNYSSFSEARRFKLMIENIWNASAGKDRGCRLSRGGERLMAHDSADERPRGKDFGNTVCSVPDRTRGFFSFVMETSNAGKEYASNRSQILALRQSLVMNSKERQSEETSSFTPQRKPKQPERAGP